MKLLKTKELTEFSKMIGANLRYIRIAKGLTQTKVSECLDVTFQQMQKYEAGTNCINAWRLTQLSEFFQVPVQDILDPDLIMSMWKLKEKQDDLKYEHQGSLKERTIDWIEKNQKEAREILDLEPKVIVGSLEKIRDQLKADGIDPDTTITTLRKAAQEKVKYDVERRMVFDPSKYEEFEDEYPAPLSQLEHDPKMRATYDAILEAEEKVTTARSLLEKTKKESRNENN